MRRGRLAFIALVPLLWLTGCGEDSGVHQQVVTAIHEMEALGEEGKRSAFMNHVADQFMGQGGSLTRDEFRAFLVLQWNQNQRLYAQVFTINVQDLGSGRASAQFKALITGGRGLIPERGQLYSITTTWIESDGDWLLSQADWEPVDPIP